MFVPIFSFNDGNPNFNPSLLVDPTTGDVSTFQLAGGILFAIAAAMLLYDALHTWLENAAIGK